MDTTHPNAAPRPVIVAVTLVVGALALAGTLRMNQSSSWFPAAALAVALIWAGGAWWSYGRHPFPTRIPPISELLPPVVLGLGLAAVFCAGAVVTQHIPPLAEQGRSVLAFAGSGSGSLLVITTALSGVAEELFFRGALYDALPQHRRLLGSVVAYTAATLLSGNILLAFAAAVLGTVTGLQRRNTGGVTSPALTHVTWSLIMLLVLPHLL